MLDIASRIYNISNTSIMIILLFNFYLTYLSYFFHLKILQHLKSIPLTLQPQWRRNIYFNSQSLHSHKKKITFPPTLSSFHSPHSQQRHLFDTNHQVEQEVEGKGHNGVIAGLSILTVGAAGGSGGHARGGDASFVLRQVTRKTQPTTAPRGEWLVPTFIHDSHLRDIIQGPFSHAFVHFQFL